MCLGDWEGASFPAQNQRGRATISPWNIFPLASWSLCITATQKTLISVFVLQCPGGHAAVLWRNLGEWLRGLWIPSTSLLLQGLSRQKDPSD